MQFSWLVLTSAQLTMELVRLTFEIEVDLDNPPWRRRVGSGRHLLFVPSVVRVWNCPPEKVDRRPFGSAQFPSTVVGAGCDETGWGLCRSVDAGAQRGCGGEKGEAGFDLHELSPQ